MKTYTIEEKALDIHSTGWGFVKNEDVDAVLKEIEKHGGYYGAGISEHGVTWIERINY